MEKAVIIGAGGIGKIILDILSQTNSSVRVIGYLDDNPRLQGKSKDGVPIVGDTSILESLHHKDVGSVIIGIGNIKYMNIRAKYFRKAKDNGFRLPNIIHPNTTIAKDVKLGEGIIICAGVVINSGAMIGDNVVIYTASTIDHDCILQGNVYVAPGVHVGKTQIRSGSYIGLGAHIIDRIIIGENTIVGAGTVVIKKFPPNSVIVGNPAKRIKNSSIIFEK